MMRWLLVKDLQILKRSPLLSALLAIYPVAIALMIGFALSSPPGKPKVAFYSEVPPGSGTISFGNQRINISGYASQLLQSIQPIKVRSRDEAIAKVKDGEALAALVIPSDIPNQLQSLVTTGVGSPTVQLFLNTRDPIERQVVDQAITSRLNQVEQVVSKQVLRVAIDDLQEVLRGGNLQFLGQSFHLLGLRNSRTILQGTISLLPRNSPLRAPLAQVAAFASVAIDGLAFASPVLGSIGNPLTVVQTQLAGKTTPTDTYAAAIAVIVSLMFVTLLLAAGMLALERTENAYSRLVRGLISPGKLLSEKVVLSAGCAGCVTLLIALPVAFVALVPANAVSGTLKSVLDGVAFVFPFKAALQAVSNAFSGTSPGIGWPLVHLLVLTLAFGVLARLAIRRYA